jgi:Xaa-Pro aminopeptidase
VDTALRRQRLAGRLAEVGADAFLVTRLPNVRYLTGFSGSNAQLLLGSANAEFLTDGRYIEQSRREVPDLGRRTYSGEFAPVFARACADLGVRKVAFEAAGVTYKLYTELSAAGVELVPTTGEVERLRWVKDPEELHRIRTAQSFTDAAFDLVTRKLAEGITEREVAFELEAAVRRLGADAPAFDTIVAFGDNAAEPHHHPTDRPLVHGDVVKIDMGALADGYHSDMTRTVAFGVPPEQVREIHEVVLQAQQAGMRAVRAGASGGEVDRAARDLIRDAGYGDHYTHSLGHGVGLEIHEGPALRSDSSDVLPAGAVVTVEPGIYLARVGGVRIEDMVEVTEDGCRAMPLTTRDLVVL